VNLTSDDRTVVVVTATGGVSTIDAATRVELRTGKVATFLVASSTLVGDDLVAVASNDLTDEGRIEVLRRADLTRVFTTKSGPEATAMIAPSARRLITGHVNGDVVEWSVDDSSRLRRGRVLRRVGDAVTALATDPRGRLLAIATRGSAFVCTVPCASVRRFDAPALASIAVSPDGRLLMAGGWGGGAQMLHVWDLRSRKKLHTLELSTPVYDVGFSRDGAVAHAVTDGAVSLWGTSPWRRLRQIGPVEDGAARIALARSGGLLVTVGDRGAVEFWDAGTGGRRRLPGHVGKVSSLAAAVAKPLVVSGGDDGQVIVWNVRDDRAVAVTNTGRAVTCVAIARDGGLIASGDDRGLVKAWSPALDAPLWTADVGTDEIDSLALSHDGRRVVAHARAGEVVSLDAATGRELARFSVPAGHYADVGLVFVGDLLATSDGHGGALLVDGSTGAIRRTMRRPGLRTRTALVAADPGGGVILSAGSDRTTSGDTLVLFDARRGRVRALLAGTTFVDDTALSHDAKWAAAASSGVAVWRLDRGAGAGGRRGSPLAPIATAAVEAGSVSAVTFTADGDLVVGTRDTGVILRVAVTASRAP
jgi:WD40 repeat protein